MVGSIPESPLPPPHSLLPMPVPVLQTVWFVLHQRFLPSGFLYGVPASVITPRVSSPAQPPLHLMPQPSPPLLLGPVRPSSPTVPLTPLAPTADLDKDITVDILSPFCPMASHERGDGTPKCPLTTSAHTHWYLPATCGSSHQCQEMKWI
ncbi:amelogenin, X isoform-like [Schistocerca americana]|uniref:amelogenin, X isoform-like n=1 Tax=Schistocerca americana TaxID=7009 RepID=UPI001F500A00|nr:amelogenin, X isoform-like [Schistocerca americana]